MIFYLIDEDDYSDVEFDEESGEINIVGSCNCSHCSIHFHVLNVIASLIFR